MYSIAEQFAAHLCGRVSTGTSRAYLSDVNGFLQAISFAGNTDAITDGAVEAYLGALREQGLKPATLNRKVSSINAFVKYLKQAELVEYSQVQTQALAVQNYLRPFPEFLSPDDVDRLLQVPDLSTPTGLRDRAMMELIYASGIQVKELLALHPWQINFKKSRLVVEGKDGAQRSVPLYPQCLQLLQRYCREVLPALPSDGEGASQDLLFRNLEGGPLSRQGFCKQVRKYAAKAGLGEGATAKALRQPFAAHLLQSGAPIQSVQALVGHLTPQSTAFYHNAVRHAARTSYKKHHPKAKSGEGKKP